MFDAYKSLCFVFGLFARCSFFFHLLQLNEQRERESKFAESTQHAEFRAHIHAGIINCFYIIFPAKFNCFCMSRRDYTTTSPLHNLLALFPFFALLLDKTPALVAAAVK